ncbi:MAG TPA: DMT family transporter [Phototrophicaceae bacterium]|nr:DMT family transporter [Phototrophicaceae bacterium]
MSFIGELAALGTSLCFSFGSTLFTLAGRAVGSALVNRVRLLIAVLLVLLLHTLTFGEVLPLSAGIKPWFWLGLSGLVGFVLGDAFLFQAFVLVGPRLSMLMMALAPILGVVLAWLFLGETLAWLELAGIAITLGGVMVVIAERGGSDRAGAADQRSYIIGLLCGLGGAAGQAGGLVLSKMGLADGFPALSGNLIRLLAATIAIWLVAVFNRQVVSSYRTMRANPRALLIMTGAVVLGPVLGVWLSLVAVQNTNVGVASTLSSLMPIFLIPISYVMFKERITRQAVIGTLIAFVGMVLLFV